MAGRKKELVVIVVDVGVSMKTLISQNGNETTRLENTLYAVDQMFQAKMLYSKTDQVGVVLFGTEETENQLYETQSACKHVTVHRHLDVVTVDSSIALRTIQTSSRHGDMFDGMMVALDLISRRDNMKSTQEKRIVLLTDAESPLNGVAQVATWIDKMKASQCTLQVIAVDISKEDVNTSSLSVKLEPTNTLDKKYIKHENLKFLNSLVQEIGGELTTTADILDLLSACRTKSVHQVTKFRGDLEISSTLKIPVWVFGKIVKQTLPTLSKESQKAPHRESQGQVKLDRTYRSQMDPDYEVPPESRVKAYRYGKQLVPFSVADAEELKYKSAKCLLVLGFVSRKDVKRTQFIGSADILVGQPNTPYAQQAISALFQALKQENRVAICRFVFRNNAAPKLMCILPNHSLHPYANENYCLYLQQLPFAEDLRYFTFPSFDSHPALPNADQQEAADELVDSLLLTNYKKGEKYSRNSTFNPVVQRFFKAVKERAFDSKSMIPKLDPILSSSIERDPHVFSQAENSIAKFKKLMGLKEQDPIQVKKAFWSTTTTSSSSNFDKENNDDDKNDDELDIDAIGSTKITSVSSINPVNDFEELLHSHQALQIDIAISGMKTQMTNFIEGGEDYHNKMILCLVHFRRGCLKIGKSNDFNVFLREIKEKYGTSHPIWNFIVTEKISLICHHEDETIELAASDAEKFLTANQVSNEPAHLLLSQSDDELFDEME